MPNKDSFTFSDKLKKSKSLPLSKRIPSRVGGDGKAKRTLIQRAQRDLPFIIVAVAALLLLPLLSRHGGTDGAGFEGSGYDDFVGQSLYDYPSSGDGEIVPSTGYRDPMDYIITNRSGMDSAGLRDSYDDSEDPSLYISRAQDSYADSKPQREIYKDVAKPGIRNAVQRKATAIGAFRNRAMSFGGSTSGLSRNLAIGGAPTTAGAAAARVGVRPVALQPLTSGGKGRVLTGEGLYAEAARSLGALNQGSAKQALFEAQLRDVDGTPLGAPGDSRRAAARIGSQGRVPDHKFGYTNERPWWWDMMNERSQKMWELWNYNWQKALSDSLIKVSTNLAMCLLTGSQDGSVEKFLGVKGGSKDICCLVDGKEICAGDIGDYTSSTSGSGDSKETTNNSFSSIQAFCETYGSTKPYVSESGAKNFLQARLECMGLKAGKMAWASGTNYAGSCANVNKTPMVYKASATRKADGKVRSGKQEKVVVYVKAKPRDKNVDTGTKDNEFVIALEKTNEFTLSQSQLEAINKNCEITRVGSFAAKNSKRKIGKKLGQYNDLNDDSDSKTVKEDEIEKKIAELEKELRNTNESSKRGELTLKLNQLNSGRYTPEAESENAEEEENNETDEMINSYVRGQVAAQYNYCTGGNSKPAKFIDEDDIMKDLRVKAEINDVCPIWYSDGTIGNRTVNGLTCNTQQSGVDFVEIDKLSRSTFSVTVNNPKDYIYAIFLEEVQSAQDQNGKSGVIVKHYVKDTAEETSSGNDMVHSKVKKGEDGRITSATYTVPYYRAGKAPESTQSNTVGSVPGNGKVFWLMTNKETPIVKAGHVFEGKVLSEINAEDLIGPTAGHKEGECFYSWGCNGTECPDKAPIATLCKDGEKIYKASKYNDYYFKSNNTPMTEEEIKEYARSHAEYDIGTFKGKLPSCNSICKHEEGVYGISGGADNEKDLRLKLDSSIVAQEVLDDCEECYPRDTSFTADIDTGKCEFNINANFNVNRFLKFNNEEEVDRQIKEAFDDSDMIKCLTKAGGVILNIEGSASVSGDNPDKNQAVSEARAASITEKIIDYIKQHEKLKGLKICYRYAPGYGTKEGWTTDATASGTNSREHELETKSETSYIEEFKEAHPEGDCIQGDAKEDFEIQKAQLDKLVEKVQQVILTPTVKNWIDNNRSQGDSSKCIASEDSSISDIQSCVAESMDDGVTMYQIPNDWAKEDNISYINYQAAVKELNTFIAKTYLPALERISYLEIYIQGKGVDSRSKGAEEEYQSIKGWVTAPSKQ